MSFLLFLSLSPLSLLPVHIRLKCFPRCVCFLWYCPFRSLRSLALCLTFELHSFLACLVAMRAGTMGGEGEGLDCRACPITPLPTSFTRATQLFLHSVFSLSIHAREAAYKHFLHHLTTSYTVEHLARAPTHFTRLSPRPASVRSVPPPTPYPHTH